METTERIVEAYARYIRRWFTLPNLKCTGQFEIDLLAIDPCAVDGLGRYHIESSISISSGFSKLTVGEFSGDLLKKRGHAASQRRMVGFFVERKFGHPAIEARLAEFGFRPGNYRKIIVSWGWTSEVPAEAALYGIELWDLKQMLREVAASSRAHSGYFNDDTMRTLQLMALADSAKDNTRLGS